MSSIRRPFVDSILHTTDFSKGSENAFRHALAISLLNHTKFTILNASPKDLGPDGWHEFPAVRNTLENWGLLEFGSSRAAVSQQLSIDVQKVLLGNVKPINATLKFLERHKTDLLVLGTEGRDGLPQWLHPSFAEQVARNSSTLTLFVPNTVKGFVSPKTGDLSIRRILLPVDFSPNPHRAIAYASRIASALNQSDLEVHLLHIGSSAEMPTLVFPEKSECIWHSHLQRGGIVDGILKKGEEEDSDLIIMTTEGHQGILDAFRGSVTEKVVRHSSCPVLAIPV